MEIKNDIDRNKEKRTLTAVLICLGIKGLGDNPEQISQQLSPASKSPSGEKEECYEVTSSLI
jgi:hypothetical protein